MYESHLEEHSKQWEHQGKTITDEVIVCMSQCLGVIITMALSGY